MEIGIVFCTTFPRAVLVTRMSLAAVLMERVLLGVPVKKGAHARWLIHISSSTKTQDTEFGCCDDRRTPAQGIDDMGCGCAASVYGCCPDGK